jgi:hypothetical protein
MATEHHVNQSLSFTERHPGDVKPQAQQELIKWSDAAGNPTDDGIAGAFIQDRFAHFLNIVLTTARQLQQEANVQLEEVSQHV